eukprot:3627570-Rhodomonas_salina.1
MSQIHLRVPAGAHPVDPRLAVLDWERQRVSPGRNALLEWCACADDNVYRALFACAWRLRMKGEQARTRTPSHPRTLTLQHLTLAHSQTPTHWL